jgi:hypothetical protein
MPRTPAEWLRAKFGGIKNDVKKDEIEDEDARSESPEGSEPTWSAKTSRRNFVPTRIGDPRSDTIENSRMSQTYKQPAKLREYKREYQKELRLQARSYRDLQKPCQQALRKIETLMKTQTGYDKNVMAQRSMLELLRMEDQIQALIHGVDILAKTIETPSLAATFEFVEGEPVEYTADQIKDIISKAGQTVYIMIDFLVKHNILELPEDFDFNGPVELIDNTRDLFKNINAGELQV